MIQIFFNLWWFLCFSSPFCRLFFSAAEQRQTWRETDGVNMCKVRAALNDSSGEGQKWALVLMFMEHQIWRNQAALGLKRLWQFILHWEKMLTLISYIRKVSKINTFKASIYIQTCNYTSHVNSQEKKIPVCMAVRFFSVASSFESVLKFSN